MLKSQKNVPMSMKNLAMPAALLPPYEDERLRLLGSLNVLDTLPEAFSDAVATAAAAIANVPISAISLVDSERQWFKASCGLEVKETTRDVSFCAHAILGTEPFLVPDALADARFRDNPLVTGAPHIRSYAGFPVVVGSSSVGALCVIDVQPRRLSNAQIEQLSQLAAGTAAWLNERESLRASLTQTEDKLRYVTLNDSVTGLPNRLVFQDRLAHAVARSSILAVLLVDIDRFEHLDETWGGVCGDTCLREVGQQLTAIVGPKGTVAKAGNHQFLVLAEDLTSVDDAANLADLIAMHLSLPIGEADQERCITVSIGISMHPVNGDVGTLVGNADTAMLSARRAGGDCYRFFETQLEVETRDRASLLKDLGAATRRGELRLHYQPKIHALSGQITGVEALLRWRHPTRGEVSPAVFIPLAERAGLISEIGHWVIAEACRQMSEWQRSGLRMRVAINLSVHQLRQPSLADEIAAELAKNGIEPALLTCEITESVAMDDAAMAFEVFCRLRAVGVRLSIDDFGTGYSSLSYLRKLSVDQIKIDRSFVIDLSESEDARAVASAIVDLAHALRLEVVAEGVETPQQRDLLLQMGCDKLQGFLFAKPMSSEAFTEWAANQDEGRLDFRPSILSVA